MIYLASPYSHSNAAVRERRFQAVCRATAALICAGRVVYSPIASSHPLARYGIPTDWDFWAKFDREVISHCNALWVLTLPGWEASRGVAAEIVIAEELRLPIAYLDIVGSQAHVDPDGIVFGFAESIAPPPPMLAYLLRHPYTERYIHAETSPTNHDVVIAPTLTSAP